LKKKKKISNVIPFDGFNFFLGGIMLKWDDRTFYFFCLTQRNRLPAM